MSLAAILLRRSLAALIALLCLIVTPAFAVTYTDNGDGTVTDPTTGLQWMRCAKGQTWDGTTCTGTAGLYSQAMATASFAGQSDWRLPNIRELQTIVARSAFGPAIDGAAFPNTPADFFWSASAAADNSNKAWTIHFSAGGAGHALTSTRLYVRLVRAGQSLALLNVARPTSDYIDHADGTVTHTPTGLQWKRCAEGENWDGQLSSCTGTAGTYTWDAANRLTITFAGKYDWRMPTEEELLSLADYTTYNPAINTTIFPVTRASTEQFWSASAYVQKNFTDWVWGVFFQYGIELTNSKPGPFHVRLVRAGQSVGSSTSTTTSTTTPTTTTTTSTTTTAPTTTTTSLTTTTTTSSTTTSSTTTTTQGGGAGTVTANLAAGWNLMGNGGTAAINVSAFNDTSKITTVWKWIANTAKWAFYAPSLAGQALTDYASSKGYDVLSTVEGGEGFWVNAKIDFSTQFSAPGAVSSGSFQMQLDGSSKLLTGWNLIAVGDNKTPSAFNKALSATPPAAGDIPLNVTTLWAWDATLTNWYFYAPSLEKSGGLLNYIQSKSYLDFGTKVLDPTMGFWVNKP